MKFYQVVTVQEKHDERYYAAFEAPYGKHVEVEITEVIKNAIEDLQREHWRLLKRDQRHLCHLNAIPDVFLPEEAFSDDPVDILLQRYESKRIADAVLDAFLQIPAKQQRRFVMRHLLEMPIKAIAESEGCSERSIKYSLHLAKKNLRDILDS